MTFPKIYQWIAAMFVMLLPAILTYALIHFHLDRQLTDFVPHEWNDQVIYWREVQTFKEVGFSGGYYAINEAPAKVSFTHFGSKGFQFPMVYGAVARLIGWDYHTSILVNLGVLALGIGAFIYLARLDIPQMLMAGAVITTGWLVLLYIPTASHEPLHQAAVIVLAGMFYRLLQDGVGGEGTEGMIHRSSPTLWMKVLFGVFLVVVGLFRFSWVFLLFPLIFLSFPRKTIWVWIITGIIGALTSGVIVFIFRRLSSGNINIIYKTVSDAQVSVGDTATAQWDKVGSNLQFFLSTDAPLMEIVARLQIMGLIILPLLWIAYRFFQTRRLPRAFWEMSFHIFNLASILGMSLLVYHPRGYYRLIGIHLLLSLLLLVAFKRYRVLAVVVAMNLLAVGSFLNIYDDWLPNFSLSPQNLVAQKDELARYIVYDPDAKDDWCNTVLIFEADYDYRATILPIGVGASAFVGYNALEGFPKSRYALLPPERFLRLDETYNHRLNFQMIAALPIGNLYYNLDRNCALLPAGYQPPDKTHLGFSDVTYAAYQNHLAEIRLFEESPVIFNPSTNTQHADPFTLSPAFRWANYAEVMSLDREARNNLFELIAVWDAMQLETDLSFDQQRVVQAWRTSKLPDDLAGIDHLLIDEEWRGWLTPEEAAILNDPNNYRLMRTWQDPLWGNSYSLYQVMH